MEEQRVALVTGAGSGVGKAVALALSRAGYTIVVAGRRREPLEETAAAIGGKTLVVTSDVRNAASVRSLFESVRNAFGRLDLLFNNAGIGAPAVPIEDLTYEELSAITGLPDGTVKSRLHRARGMLKLAVERKLGEKV